MMTYDILTQSKAKSPIEGMFAMAELAEAINSPDFAQLMDSIPIAILLLKSGRDQRVLRANTAFERRFRYSRTEVEGLAWLDLQRLLEMQQYAVRVDGTVEPYASDGVFYTGPAGSTAASIQSYSTKILGKDRDAKFTLMALVDVNRVEATSRRELEQRLFEKDVLLQEMQHRVKNDLQRVTALIRLEARERPQDMTAAPFERLIGCVEAMQFLYQAMSDRGAGIEVDIGVYLAKIAQAVMSSRVTKSVRLDLKVDSFLVPTEVAFSVALVVNELLTNALKHAFNGCEGGTISLRTTASKKGYRILVADDGVGFTAEFERGRGKLGMAIIEALRETANATLDLESSPGQGVRATITFPRSAAPATAGIDP